MKLTASNKEIGEYLKLTIKQYGYDSVRQFGKVCLEAKGLPTEQSDIGNESNRLSQIIRGERGVQLEDLLLYSRLLDVSCEEILTAGESRGPSAVRMCNCSVAASKDKKLWENYVNREDKLILNADEYGKTVIDYALEYENYGFMKYLTDEGYIWFVDSDKGDYLYSFGAGTSIESAPFHPLNIDVLDAKLQVEDKLRRKMIVLALKNGDTEMLEMLRARETPEMYFACNFKGHSLDFKKNHDPELIRTVAECGSDEVLKYFGEEYEITCRNGNTYSMTFPFIGELIDALLQQNNNNAEWILENAIEHNRRVYNKMLELIDKAMAYYRNIFGDDMTKGNRMDHIADEVMRFFDLYGDDSFLDFMSIEAAGRVASNIIRVNGQSDSIRKNRLIKELNDTYDMIINIKPKF